MVGVAKRMRSLHQRITEIRLGTGAVILPKEIKRIHLRFADGLGGHLGGRKFWHNELVRLQYHNPAVLMTTDRQARVDEPATLSIHFAPPVSKSPTSSAAPSESNAEAAASDRVETIDIKHKHTSQILEELIKVTSASLFIPTQQDLDDLTKAKEQEEKSNKDRVLMNAVKAKKQREKDILAAARGTPV